MDIDAFIAKWSATGGAERANKDMFLIELCEVLDVPKPEPLRNDGTDQYGFEYPVAMQVEDGSTIGRIDLYKAGCFVLGRAS